MTVARYLLGVASLALVAAALTLAAGALRNRIAPGLEGPSRHLATATLAFALAVLGSEALGTLGLFQPGPVLAGAAVGGWLSIRSPGPRSAAGEPPRRPPQPEAATAAIVAAIVAAEWLTPSLAAFDTGIRSFDSLWYHLPWAASFAQSGNVASLRFTDVEYLTAFYPASGELLHGLGIVLLGRDTLSPALNLLFLAGTLLAAWCAGRPFGLAPQAIAGAGLALALPMVRFSQAGTAANDVVGTFPLIAALAFSVSGARGATVLACLAAGLAISVKLSLLAPALAVAAIALVTAPAGADGASRPRRDGVVALLAGGGYWFARNLFLVGNPLPWIRLHGALPGPPPALQHGTAFSVAHYLLNGGGWQRYFEPGLRSGLGPLWPAVIALAVLGPLACLSLGRTALLRALGGAALLALAAYLVTPESAAGPLERPSGFAFNLRYCAPALTLALVIGPLALAGRLRPSRTPARIALGFAGAMLAATVSESRLWPGGYAATAVGAVLLTGITVAAWVRASRARPSGLTAVAGATLALLTAGGYEAQSHYLAHRYNGLRRVSSLAPVWTYFRNVHHARVALTGTFGGFFAFPLSGLDLSNRVQYLGVRGSHGGFRALRTCPEFAAALRVGDPRYLVVTPDRDPWRPAHLSRSAESGWIAGAPGARPLLRAPAGDQQTAVYELDSRALVHICDTNRRLPPSRLAAHQHTSQGGTP